jgi:hypothetical protein
MSTSESKTSYAIVTYLYPFKDRQEIKYDLYKTKLGVHNSDMWYDISCYTDNDFTFAGEIEEWAKEAQVGEEYKTDKLVVKISDK